MTGVDLEGRIRHLVVRGAPMRGELAEAVTSATLSLTAAEVTELQLVLVDHGDLRLLTEGLFEPGTPTKAGSRLDYGRLKLEVRALEVAPRGIDHQVTVTARSWGAGKLRRARGAKVRRGLSPTSFARLEAKDANLEFVGQPSAKRGNVSRTKDESSWDALQRLASELGYLCFETLGTLYFGKPTWLIGRTDTVEVKWRQHRTHDSVDALPRCRRSGDDAKRAATVEVQMRGAAGEGVLPGHKLVLDGIPSFDGDYMVSSVSVNLAVASGGVMVNAETPINPKPQPPQKAGGGGGSSGGEGTASGATTPAGDGAQGTAARFVAIALAQAGDTYIYGAEASASDPDPDAFDCSELIEWAAARAGVSFVDGSAAQIAACQAVSVETAIRTRGALLYHPGHIAISLGNGNTIEAANSRVGVVSYSAAGRFTQGGLIPGMRY